MRVDLYKRMESEGKFSYLAVPEGELIPEEVVNIDWQDVSRGVELGDSEADSAYAIAASEQQILEKGYAITAAAPVQGRLPSA
jgi:hypothetical protein